MSVGEEKDVFGVDVSQCAREAGGRRTVHDRGRQLRWVLVVLWMLAPGAVQAQESSRQPTAEEASVTEAPPQASQVGAMLGGAEYMLILDRPFAAEKLFNGVLAMAADDQRCLILEGAACHAPLEVVDAGTGLRWSGRTRCSPDAGPSTREAERP